MHSISFPFKRYVSRSIIEVKSDNIGDPSLIGLSCESGDFSDCELPKSNDHIPIGCKGVLMFSTDSNTYGSNCNPKRSKRSNHGNQLPISSSFGGWTPYYNNDDDPSGTGDHEHYFYFRNKDWYYRGQNAKKMIVYGQDGQAYKNCKRTAIFVRKKTLTCRIYARLNSHVHKRLFGGT